MFSETLSLVNSDWLATCYLLTAPPPSATYNDNDVCVREREREREREGEREREKERESIGALVPRHTHEEVRGQLLEPILPIHYVVSGTEFKSSGMVSSALYLLSHLSGPLLN